MDLTSSRSIVTKSYRFEGVKFGFGDLFDGSCYLQGSFSALLISFYPTMPKCYLVFFFGHHNLTTLKIKLFSVCSIFFLNSRKLLETSNAGILNFCIQLNCESFSNSPVYC